jgi:dTDP-glucose 4,6-dehydratase
MKFKFLVTGGRGFIGSHFVERVLNDGHRVVDIDKMTYCSNKSLPWDNDENYKLIKKDINDLTHLPESDFLVNFAAESHVDNSINSPLVFSHSNYNGTQNLLELVRSRVYNRPLFVQVSTDEVYGDIRETFSTEEDSLVPSNPYSASKAAAEMLVLAYNKTFDIDYLITRSSNNYGPRQYEEKLVPKIINCLQDQRKIPIHGDGSYIRDWIYVKDNANAIYHLIMNHYKNDIFNVSVKNHMTNLEVVEEICKWFGLEDIEPYVEFVPNRLGQDLRYYIENEKLLSTRWKVEYPHKMYNFISHD